MGGSGSAAARSSTQALNAASPTACCRVCRDLLKGYAALQRFKPRPVPKSVCYTGARLLEAFGHPYEEDANKVAAAYPWLEGYDGGCTEAEAKWGAF